MDLPLIDLHCHLDGSITMEIAKKLAQLQNINLPEENDKELEKDLSLAPGCESLNDFLNCFELPSTLLQTKEGISEAVYLVQENVKSQGIVYLELRFAPQLHCKKGLSQKDAIEAALEGLKKSDLHTNLILCCMRGQKTHEANLETVKLAKEFLTENNGVVALDLAGGEALYSTEEFSREFKTAKELGVPFTIHAGEASGAESVKCAVSYGPKRIGHGIRSYEDKNLVEEIKEKNIILEICPTSNKQTKAFADMKDYPFMELLHAGVKVTVNTDDMAICRTTLKDEYLYLEKEFGLSDADEKILYRNSVEAAFTTAEVKEWLFSLV